MRSDNKERLGAGKTQILCVARKVIPKMMEALADRVGAGGKGLHLLGMRLRIVSKCLLRYTIVDPLRNSNVPTSKRHAFESVSGSPAS